MKITKTATVQVSNDFTVAALKDILAQVPPTARIRIDHYAGNQLDPGYTNLTFSWVD